MTFAKKLLAAALVSATALTAMPAMADRSHGWRHGGHYGGHHHHRGFGHAGAFIGGAIVAGALLSPWYYAPSYYYPPTYYYRSYPTVIEVSPPAPTVYIEQPQAAMPAAASDAGNWWYYCNDTRAYYPYVKECASPWQRVAPQPAPGAPR